MTLVLRPRASLFHAEGGWFSANWHFSFDQYWDEANMGIGDLRVFNDDRLVPGAAWPMHPHRDIEGITYVAEGTFEHADSRGNGGILHPGAVQRATLGSGMQHSERNASKTEPMRFIQMWIMPSRRGLEPSIEQREFALLFKKLATLRTDAPLFKKVETLHWRGATPAFAKWAKKMDAPGLIERCEAVMKKS